MNDEDDYTIEYDIVSLDRPPEEYFGYNYEYGRKLVRDAMLYLHKTYPGREGAAMALLGGLLE